MLAESCLLNANAHPCRSVSMSESRAALWTMDVVGVIGFVARLARQQRFVPRCTHCGSIREPKPLLRFRRQREDPALCTKKIVRAQRGDENTSSMYFPILVADFNGRHIVLRHAAQRCHRAVRVGQVEAPAPFSQVNSQVT